VGDYVPLGCDQFDVLDSIIVMNKRYCPDPCQFCRKIGQVRRSYAYGRYQNIEMSLCIVHVRVFCHIRKVERDMTYPADSGMVSGVGTM
jgi:hypothetical protein